MPPPRVPTDQKHFFNKKKTVTAKIVSVTFQKDHRDPAGKKLLKKSLQEPITVYWLNPDGSTTVKSLQSEYGDTFGEFKKPEWDIARGGSADSHPVSYSKGQSIEVDVEIEFTVTPAGQSVSLTNIAGVSSYYLNFNQSLSQQVKTGRVSIPNVVSTTPLPNYVWFEDENIDWTVTVDGKPISVGTTGSHRVYSTFAMPRGTMDSTVKNAFTETGSDQIVTEKRLEFSVMSALSTGRSNEKECVDAIFKAILLKVGYVLYRRWVKNATAADESGVRPIPTLHHYLWLCMTSNGQGECHNIAAAFALACRIIGVAGTFQVGYMYPWPGRAGTPSGSWYRNELHPTYPRSTEKSPSGRNILGKYNDRYFRIHTADHQTEFPMFLDGSGSPNNFEGVTCYQGNALYAIGDDVFDQFHDPNDNASLYFLVRNMDMSDTSGNRIRRAINSQNTGFFQLVFADSNSYAQCSQPYPWLARRRLTTDPSSPLYNKSAMWFKWEE
jgi:hypothetical protein